MQFQEKGMKVKKEASKAVLLPFLRKPYTSPDNESLSDEKSLLLPLCSTPTASIPPSKAPLFPIARAQKSPIFSSSAALKGGGKWALKALSKNFASSPSPWRSRELLSLSSDHNGYFSTRSFSAGRPHWDSTRAFGVMARSENCDKIAPPSFLPRTQGWG